MLGQLVAEVRRGGPGWTQRSSVGGSQKSGTEWVDKHKEQPAMSPWKSLFSWKKKSWGLTLLTQMMFQVDPWGSSKNVSWQADDGDSESLLVERGQRAKAERKKRHWLQFGIYCKLLKLVNWLMIFDLSSSTPHFAGDHKRCPSCCFGPRKQNRSEFKTLGSTDVV